MKILIDMNLSPRWAEMLMQNGIEAIHWEDVGDNSAPDIEIMHYAIKNGWTVLTHDLDFATILADTHWQKPSVIQIRCAVHPEFSIKQVVSAIYQTKDELEKGALVTINPRKTRLRILPFGE
jgi:predicted nuclease of predicted toxin-antitoxin system